jgi:hypothetical protein
MPPKEPGKRGPKPQYQHEKRYQAGAPLLTTRINPETLDWIQSRPEGTRPYLERVVGEDRKRTQAEGTADKSVYGENA